MTGIVSEPSPWEGWHQLALVLGDWPPADADAAEWRSALRVVIADCRAQGKAERHDERSLRQRRRSNQ